ncbi:MAG: glycosyltransferase family 2 protein [Clostridia bacterium]|nr:glycosyltransferase family 2 protein [Clostridia bacterium]
MADKLFIVMPAYNEEENIEQVVVEWHEVVEKIGPDSKLVIFNDGSKDNTYKKLLELKEKYPQLEPVDKPNSGHGATVLYAYNYAIENKADYIFQTDSDGQTLPSEFWPFWEERTQYAAIIGHRNHRQDGFSRVFVTKTLKLVIKLVFGESVTDANTPFRLMPRATLEKYVPQIPKDFNLSNVILSVLLVHNKENVKFTPITFRPRQGGVNSINFKKICKIGMKAVKDFKVIKKTIKENDKKKA